MPSVSRRRVLAASAASLTAFAGCSALSDSEAGEKLEPFAIGGISLSNYDSERAFDVDLVVRRDGDTVHWETYEVPPVETTDGRRTVQSEPVHASAFGGCTPGFYDLAIRLDGDSWDDFEMESRADGSDDGRDGYWRTVQFGGQYGDDIAFAPYRADPRCGSSSETTSGRPANGTEPSGGETDG